MKHIALTILSLLFLLLQVAKADNTIKVLMLESPYDQLPSEQAESIYNLTGKVFINGQFYEGSLEVMMDENGFHVVNSLPFGKYIEGVVASEIGDDWELEALKAQAVISRTYASFHKTQNEGKSFHLSSSVLHQLYKGNNEDPLITYAVNETRGEILIYDNLPIQAYYHATCEGKTEVPEEVWEESYPYLKSVDCNSKNAPYENWQRKFTLKEIEKNLGINNLIDINIVSYTATGRVKTLKLILKSYEAEKSVIEIKSTELRKLLGYKELPSTHFTLTKTGEVVIFVGKGYGHGVGLCQWGALEMAKQGINYREILAHYYPGTILKNNEGLYSQAKDHFKK